ncbi:PorV/PorQ family protein, partial [candidate division KSB1 bacterium]|nr:PorV/PorQ family protein [candidate division KSB1 bacterium]
MKIKIFLVIIIFVTSATIGLTGENPASTGLSFLKIGASARAVGMGEAFTALVDDVSGTFWNPAGLARLQNSELVFTHNEWLQDITNEYFSLGFNVGKNIFGLSFMSNTVGGIERRVKPTAEPLGIVNAHDVMFGLSYARLINTNLSIGATAKFLYEKIYVESSSGVAVDLGLQYRTKINGLSAGFVLQNFGYMTQLKEESIQLPQTVRLGLAYLLPLQLFQGGITVASDWVKIFESTSHINIGLEYFFKGFFALR